MRSNRTAALATHVEHALRHARLSSETYADEVRRLYQERTPEGARVVQFQNPDAADDPYRALRHNAQTVRRYLGLCEQPIRLLADLEEAMVLALPEPYRAECLRELAARYGLLAARMPGHERAATALPLADLMRETAEVVEAVAPLMADGLLDSFDGHLQINQALQQLADLEAACASQRAQLEAGLQAVTFPSIRQPTGTPA